MLADLDWKRKLTTPAGRRIPSRLALKPNRNSTGSGKRPTEEIGGDMVTKLPRLEAAQVREHDDADSLVRIALNTARKSLHSSTVIVEQPSELLPGDDDSVSVVLALIGCLGVFREHLLQRIRGQEFALLGQGFIPAIKILYG